jgi:hypothetical protein
MESIKVNSNKAASIIGVTMQELKRLRAERLLAFYRISHRTVVYDLKDIETFLISRRVTSVVEAS